MQQKLVSPAKKTPAEKYELISGLCILDHPVNPPTSTRDPWLLDFPDDKNYTIKANNGVFEIFQDAECTQQMDYTYTKLSDFVQDMHTMCSMIADGPL